MSIPNLTLNDGTSLPAIGFGTWPLVGDEGYRVVRSALDAGYRLIDSAVNYENEGTVGKAIRDFMRESGTPREEITVQTKLPGRHHDTDRAVKSGYESAARLGLDQIDVMLIHWPNPITGKYLNAWRGLIALQEQGIARSIGVSNFNVPLLRDIIDGTGVTPVLNQIELHPFFQRPELTEYCVGNHILIEAWAPLMRGGVLDIAELIIIGKHHKKTASQIAIRWSIQRGFVPLPKSEQESRIRENFEVFDFELTKEEMDTINALDAGMRIGPDPETFSWEWPKSMKR